MKLDISSIDKNFLQGSNCPFDNLVWKDILEEPFEIRGLAVKEGERFERLPKEIAENVSEGVKLLSTHTAGGRVRFATDSKNIAIRCESLYSGSMPHMPLTGSMGVDVYINGEFMHSVRPQNDDGGLFEGWFGGLDGMNEFEINMPLYNGIKRMYIGFVEGSSLTKPRKYAIDKPIVYYGSSITQGGCASRPGNSYQGFISRWLDADHINLGFSGNAKGEPLMAEYISKLDMSAFVLDYDHNAPSAEHLEATHEAFFKTVRTAHPDTPILIVTKPDFYRDPNGVKRAEIVKRTYENAVKAGDKNVYFLHGKELFTDKDRDACTVDGCHPNDLGFYRMAQAMYDILKDLV